MTTKQAYQEKIEAQLREWQLGLDKLRVKAARTKAETKLEYQQQIDALAVKQQAARQKFEALKQASSDKWDTLKVNVDKAMTDLQQGFEQFQTTSQQYGDEVLNWAKGIAQEHKLHSIGWAEGLAKEKETDSIGWAEGVAQKPSSESKGWPEGVAKEAEHESAGWAEGYSKK